MLLIESFTVTMDTHIITNSCYSNIVDMILLFINYVAVFSGIHGHIKIFVYYVAVLLYFIFALLYI